MLKKQISKLQQRLIGLLIHLLQPFSKQLTAGLAYWWWRRTRRIPSSAKETAFLQTSTIEIFHFERETVRLYHWGKGPKVLICPGWNGRAGQLKGLTQALLDMGIGVCICEPPGHGMSSGKATSILQISRLIEDVLANSTDIKGFIGHSAGAMAGFIALSGQASPIPHAVFIGMPNSSSLLLKQYCKHMKLKDNTCNTLKKRFLKEHGQNAFERSSPLRLTQKLSQNWLLVHDKKDFIVPIKQAQELQQSTPEITLYTSDGLGHFRIYRSVPVINRICDYFNENFRRFSDT